MSRYFHVEAGKAWEVQHDQTDQIVHCDGFVWIVLDGADDVQGIATRLTSIPDPALDAIESRLDADGHVGLRSHVSRIRADAIGYRRFLAPQRLALERLTTAPVSWMEPDDRLHVQEAADRCARMAEELESLRERSALAHETLTDLRAEHMNQQALILAVVALIFLPLTFITGLLGMNVEGIPLAREPWAFWGVTGFCVLVAGALGIWFVATNWLKK